MTTRAQTLLVAALVMVAFATWAFLIWPLDSVKVTSPRNPIADARSNNENPGLRAAPDATTPRVAAWPTGSQNVNDSELSAPSRPKARQKDAQDPREFPGADPAPIRPVHHVVPTTPEQRAWFNKTILELDAENLPALCFTRLRGRYANQLRPSLDAEHRAAALALVDRLADAEFRHRTAIDEALRRYVLSEPDLSTSAHPAGVLGRTGQLAGGVGQTNLLFAEVGGRTVVSVKYFLSYASYPEVHATGAELQTLKRELRAYQ